MKNYNSSPIYYFAYGSNMSHKQMLLRCPHSKFVGKGYITDWRLEFKGFSIRWRGAVATIQEKKGNKVWGAVYELDQHCMKKLDRYEHVPLKHYRHRLLNCSLAGKTTPVYTYVKYAGRPTNSAPSSRYLKQIIAGAKTANLPESYIVELENTIKAKER